MATKFQEIMSKTPDDVIVLESGVQQYLNVENPKCLAQIQKYFDDNGITGEASKNCIQDYAKKQLDEATKQAKTNLVMHDQAPKDAADAYALACQGVLSYCKSHVPTTPQ